MKTKRTLLKAAVLTCLANTYIVTVQGQSPAPTPAAVTPLAVIQPKLVEDPSVRAGWRRYQFGDAPFFSVILPTAPEATAERAGGSASAVAYLYISTTDSGIYVASRLDSIGLNIERETESERQKFFRTYIEGFARGFQESMKKENLDYELKLLEPRKVTAAGREAFQQDLTVGPFQGSAQLVFAGTGAFCVLSIWNARAPAADRDAFFHSFQLTGTPK
jgi:hypothetical protein